MDEAAICTAGQNLDSERSELVVFGGNCRQFSRSDEGEIPGIEAKGYPFPMIIREFDVLESSIHKGAGLEIRSWFPYACNHFGFLLLGW